MKYIFNSAIFLALVFLTLSCNNTKTSKVEGKPNVEIETPKVLLKEESITTDLLGSGIGKYRGYQDMVDELFDEACEQNKELNSLHQHIQSEISNAHKMIEEFVDYKNVVEKVSLSALTHANYINNDSLLVDKLVALGDSNKETFKKMIEPHLFEIEMVKSNSVRLENTLEELKINTALKMMKGFRDNEIPDLASLSRMNEHLENLIDRTKGQSGITN